ncbi:hypothetical protein [Cellulomonas sp. P24]|uniref:hypothetical protein n=1 Tax=Cellulomonas sp. P24 TaxID=2885206 RepID=UPI00216AE6EC|nr:hypothetical protein [Cellulomonas sp. P24]MCR6493153.1 hypothetical protein [Cellulomonas sp. P24]
MSDVTLVDTIARLTVVGVEVIRHTLDGDISTGDRTKALATLLNMVRQAPATHADRAALLDGIQALGDDVPTGQILAASRLLRTYAPRFPDSGTQVELPTLDPVLTGAMETVFALDAAVPDPWTLVGGLMVMLHCLEHQVQFTRATGDADLAVGVFTHRDALSRLTQQLRLLGFEDITPAPLAGGSQLSYRWAKAKVAVDLMVPEAANSQDRVPIAVNRRPAVELPATQQALARSERVRVTISRGPEGTVRRPNLLGALIMKASAAVTDRREPERHVADLVVLCHAVAVSGHVSAFANQLRPKDLARLRKARARLTMRDWRRSSAPDEARGALDYLVDDSGLGARHV